MTYMEDPGFVKRWFNLPEELKIEVLSHILQLDDTFFWDCKANTLRLMDLDVEIAQCPAISDLGVLSLLSAPGELSRLSTELFYSRNRFLVGFGASHMTLDLKRHHPKPHIGRFIRELGFVHDITVEAWMFLMQIADGSLGYDSLRVLHVVLHVPETYEHDIGETIELVEYIAFHPLLFKIKELHVEYVPELETSNKPQLQKFYAVLRRTILDGMGLVDEKPKLKGRWAYASDPMDDTSMACQA